LAVLPAPPPDVVEPWRKSFDLLVLTLAPAGVVPPVCLVCLKLLPPERLP
jgi:hypothetical protein